MKKVIALFLVVCMAITVFAGCGKDENPGTTSASTGTTSSAATATPQADDPSETGTLNLVWFAANGTDSLFECGWQDMQSLYHDMVFDSLIKLKEDSVTYVPKLASKWSISDDGLTYAFTLNPDAKWHDGTAFTQEDVVFSFNTTLKFAKSLFKNTFGVIEGAQAVIDGQAQEISGISAKDGVVTIKLTSPDHTFLRALCQFVILPKHLLKDADPATIETYEKYWKKPVGTGAYKIDEVSFPNYFTTVRNDEYHGPKAGIKKALFTSYATGGNEAVVSAAAAGKVDFAFGNAVNDINTAKNISAQNADVKSIIIPSTLSRVFMFNTNGSSDDKYNAAVKKPEVRQALSLLIDKELIAGFYSGQAVPMSTYINPELPAYNSDIPLFKRDVAKGKQMLTDAGFDFSKPLRVLYYYDDQTTADIMEVIKQNFAEAGVKVEPFLAKGDLASIIYEQRNWDLMYAANIPSVPVLAYYLLYPSGGNYDKLFADLEIRAQFKVLIDQYKAANNAADQKKIGDQLQVLGNQLCYATAVYSLNKIVIYNAARLQLDMEVFSADNQNLRDNRFENWKLLK